MFKISLPSKFKRNEPLQAQIDYLTSYLAVLSREVETAVNATREDEKAINKVYISQGNLIVEWSDGKVERYAIGG